MCQAIILEYCPNKKAAALASLASVEAERLGGLAFSRHFREVEPRCEAFARCLPLGVAVF